MDYINIVEPINDEELDAILNAARECRPGRVLPPLTPGIDIDELCDIASETDERGPLETIVGLLRGLGMRHADDEATAAALSAIELYHLPALLDRQVIA